MARQARRGDIFVESAMEIDSSFRQERNMPPRWAGEFFIPGGYKDCACCWS
jgi:hypothetical protein